MGKRAHDADDYDQWKEPYWGVKFDKLNIWIAFQFICQTPINYYWSSKATPINYYWSSKATPIKYAESWKNIL